MMIFHSHIRFQNQNRELKKTKLRETQFIIVKTFNVNVRLI
jgi:hypothetical protein